MKKPQPAKVSTKFEINNLDIKAQLAIAGITFNIESPDSKPGTEQPVIYYDRPKASNLVFTLSQSPQLGIPSIGPKDRIVIRFPGNLLKTIGQDNMPGKGWKAAIEEPTDSNQNKYEITLTPTAEIKFGTEELTIRLPLLQGTSTTSGDVTLRVSIGGKAVPMTNTSVKLFVLSYPDQPKDLDDSILFPSVTFNDDQSAIAEHDRLFLSKSALQPPIANRLKLNLKCSENPLVEKWDRSTEKWPFFNISFSYGSSANDLTDEFEKDDKEGRYNALTSAYNIVASSVDDARWTLLKGTDTTIWTIAPTTANHHLFTKENDNLDIVLEHIISRLPEGNATIYIQWGNIPGYNDGWKARNIIKKKPAPRITAFTGPKGAIEYSVKYGAGISLEWDVFAAPKVQLRCKEAPYLNQSFDSPLKGVTPALVYCGGVVSKAPGSKNSCGSLIVKSLVSHEPESNFYLQALDEEGKPVGDEVGPVTVTIDDYPAPAFKGALHVKEAITPFTNTTGEPTFYISPADTAFTLQWQVKDPNVVEDISIIGPTGKTIKTINDPTQTQVSLPYRQDGAYQVTLKSKESAHSITERFVVNQLFSAKRSFGASMEQNIPLSTLRGKASVKYSVTFEEKTADVRTSYRHPLNLAYQIKLRFQSNGTGTLDVNIQNNQLPSVKEHIVDVAEFTVLSQITFKHPSLSLPKDISQSFSWKMHTDGRIDLQLTEAADAERNWTVHPLKDSTPDNLTYQFSLGENHESRIWYIPTSDQPHAPVLAEITFPSNGRVTVFPATIAFEPYPELFDLEILISSIKFK